MWELDLKKAECQTIDAFELWCWRRLLRVPWTARRANQLILKGNQPWIFIGRIDAEAEAAILWPPDAKNWLIGKDSDAGKDWGQEEKSLFQKRGEQRSLHPLLKQGFTSLCPCHDYYLKVFTRDKHWLFTLFLLLLPFQRANRRLIVNSSTGAHLSLVSGNANRKLVESVLPEAHFFLVPKKSK